MLASVALPLALSGDQWLTLAGVLTGAIGVIGGFVFAYYNGKAERLHTRQLAISTRLYEQRLAAYVEVGRLLERQNLYVSRVEFSYKQMLHVPMPDPPEQPSVDDWTMIMGKAKVSASAEVLEALQEVSNTTYRLDDAIAVRKFFLEDPENRRDGSDHREPSLDSRRRSAGPRNEGDRRSRAADARRAGGGDLGETSSLHADELRPRWCAALSNQRPRSGRAGT